MKPAFRSANPLVWAIKGCSLGALPPVALICCIVLVAEMGGPSRTGGPGSALVGLCGCCASPLLLGGLVLGGVSGIVLAKRHNSRTPPEQGIQISADVEAVARERFSADQGRAETDERVQPDKGNVKEGE